MAYVISEPCIDTMDRSCVRECPVDCIYEGARALYIQPDECIDCGACETVCPVDSIAYEEDVLEAQRPHVQDNADFFKLVLPGMEAPLGRPGGAKALGPIGKDTPLVASHGMPE